MDIELLPASSAGTPIKLDPAQQQLAEQLSAFLALAFADRAPENQKQDNQRLAHTGFYIYGPAGRGKSWLAAQLFEAAQVPEHTKRRLHFHEFFREFQKQTANLPSTREAIEHTLDELLDGAKLFYFDELHVHDPGSAALLNRLLQELDARSIPTLITSNYEPERLLENRVYHHIILPGIKLIRERFAVRTLDGGQDYRQLSAGAPTGFASGRWIIQDSENQRSEGQSPGPMPGADEAAYVLEGHRALSASAVRGTQIWFDFSTLIQTPSYPEDFLILAEEFDSWVLTGVRPLSGFDRAARQRFVSLIDVLADRDLKLELFAHTGREEFADIAYPPADLFRCLSRLALLRG